MGDLSPPAAARPTRAQLVRTIVLPSVSAVIVVVGYFTVLPLDGVNEDVSLLLLLGWLAILAVVIVVQARQIIDAPFPVLRAVGVLAVVLPLYLIAFSVTYYLMSHEAATTFGDPLSRMAALYFTVTVFATVGFGDIHAHNDSAMAVVTVQMMINLLLLGFGVRALAAAARMGRERQGESPTP